MPEDSPEFREVVEGVANQMDLTDIGAAVLLTLFGTVYGAYDGIKFWWALPPLLGIGIFGIEAVKWRYFRYPEKQLREKSKALA